MDDATLNWVETAEDAFAFMRWLGERRPILGMDTETTGLKPYAGDTLRLVQFGDAVTGWAISALGWRALIKEAIAKYTSPIVFQNVKFDLHFLEQAGLPIPAWNQLHDSAIMAKLRHPQLPAGLKQTGERLWPGSSVGETVLNEAKRAGKWTWATIPEDHPAYWGYSAWDPVLTTRISDKYWPEVQTCRAAYDREMAYQRIMYGCERRGLRVDPEYTAGLRSEWDTELVVLHAELRDMGLANANSGRQIAQAMQLTEGWDPTEFTETGLPKVDAGTMKGIDSDISRRVLRLRRLTKWRSAYLNKFLQERDAGDCVHASINTLQARTGRSSITGIPLQTLPSRGDGGGIIRTCVLPYEGDQLWASDFDNVEMRGFAHFSQDPRLLGAAREGLDMHKYTASLVYGVEMENVTKEQRALAKQSVSFGKLYGAGKEKVAASASATEEQVDVFLNQYAELFPGVDAFTRQVIDLGRKRGRETGAGYITTWGGRYAPCDDDKFYALVNYLIQGSCADIFKERVIAVDNAGYGDNIVIPIHDEVLFSFPKGDTESPVDASNVLAAMTELSVPLTTGLKGPFDNWGQAYD